MNKNGFTILEVVLFLAISSGLAVIVFLGLTPRLNNVRFTQSMRTTEAALARQFNSSIMGENTRSDDFTCVEAKNDANTNYPRIVSPDNGNVSGKPRGSSDTCVVNGKLVVFATDKMRIFSLVSFRKPHRLPDYSPSGCENSADDLDTTLDCYKTRIARGKFFSINEPPDVVEVPFTNGVTATSNIGGEFNGKPLVFGYVQNPERTDKYQFFYTFGDPHAGIVNPDINPKNTPPVAYNTRKTVPNPNVCFKLGTRTASMTFDVSSIRPKIVYNTDCT